MHILADRSDRQFRYRSVKYKLSRGSSFIQQSTQPVSGENSKFFPTSTKNISAKKASFTSKILPLNRTMYSKKQNPEDNEFSSEAYIGSVARLLSMEKNRHNAK